MTWWLIPLIVTLASLAWAITRDTSGDGWLSGVSKLFYVCVAAFVSTVAWAVFGVWK